MEIDTVIRRIWNTYGDTDYLMRMEPKSDEFRPVWCADRRQAVIMTNECATFFMKHIALSRDLTCPVGTLCVEMIDAAKLYGKYGKSHPTGSTVAPVIHTPIGG